MTWMIRSKFARSRKAGGRKAGAGLALLASLALASSGCKTVSTDPASQRLGLSSTPGKPDPNAPKTDFHASVNVEQQYQVHVDFGRLQESNGNFETAIAEYQKAIDVCHQKGSFLGTKKVGPVQEAEAERKMAGAYDRLGRFAQAETHYEKALRLVPGDWKIWNDAGYSLTLQNRWGDSERALKQADALEPNNQKVLTNLGLTLAKQDKTEEALAALTKAGGPAVAHANLGYIFASMGKADLARKHYQEAIALQPQMTAPRVALAKLERDSKPPATLVASAPGPIDPATRTASTASTTPSALLPMAPKPATAPPSIVEAAKGPRPLSDKLVAPSAGSAPMVAPTPVKPAATKPSPKPAPVSTSSHEPKRKAADVAAPGPLPIELSRAPALGKLPELPELPEALKDAGLKRTSFVPLAPAPDRGSSTVKSSFEPAPARKAQPSSKPGANIEDDLPALPPLGRD